MSEISSSSFLKNLAKLLPIFVYFRLSEELNIILSYKSTHKNNFSIFGL